MIKFNSVDGSEPDRRLTCNETEDDEEEEEGEEIGNDKMFPTTRAEIAPLSLL